MNTIAANPPRLDASRTTALDAWGEENPSAHVDECSLREAASCATLVDTADGPRFDERFAGFVEFVAELPF